MKIEVTDSFLGTHFWKDCPFEEVAFLKHEHHHDFIVKASCVVVHDDRDIEFLRVRKAIRKFMSSNYVKQYEIIRFCGRSCEMISTEITEFLKNTFGDKNWKVSVSEDGNARGGDW